MKDTAYIVVTAEGVQRMTKRVPSLAREELAVKVTITVPDASFRPWMVTAALDVPEDRVILPTVDATVDAPEAQS